MSSPSVPTPPTPQEGASAAVQATQAGDIYQTANAPITGYADLYTQALLGPARAQLQQGLANQQALQSAQGQLDIQSRVDPMAYAIRQMNLQQASRRLGQLYGVDPSLYAARFPSAYGTPTAAGIPALSDLTGATKAIAGAMMPVTLSKGGQINLGSASGSGTIPGSGGAASTLPSYLGVYG